MKPILLLCIATFTLCVLGNLKIDLKRHEPTLLDDFSMITQLAAESDENYFYIPFKYGKLLFPISPLNMTNPSPIPFTNFLNAQFYAEIQIGTPFQTLNISFDTGSSNMFVLAPNCSGLQCWDRVLYNWTLSSSYAKNGTRIKLQYGSGNFSGFLGNDNILLGGVVVKDVEFALIDNPNSDAFLYARWDGLIGIAFESMAVDSIASPLQVMIDKGLLSTPSFSIYLTKDYVNTTVGSFILFGGIDMRYADTKFNYVNLSNHTLYMFEMDDVKLGNKSFMHEPMRAFVDSGTSIIVGSEHFINPIIAQFPVSIDCDTVESFPNLSFVINGISYDIPPTIYIIQQFGHCILGIVPAIFEASLKNTIVLGDTFIRQFYTHFDYGGGRIGFAKAANITHVEKFDAVIS